jgi:hypothetical protein
MPTTTPGRKGKVEVRNVNHPGQVNYLDARMYEAMKQAVLKVLPRTSPGLTVAEMQEGVLIHLPASLFPNGAKAGWWAKAVQLDLEAKRRHRAREDQAAAVAQMLTHGG